MRGLRRATDAGVRHSNGRHVRIATAVLPEQAPLRRPGRLRPPPQPRAGTRSVTRSRCSPASPTPTSTRASG